MVTSMLFVAFIISASLAQAEGSCQLMGDMNQVAVAKHNLVRTRHSANPLTYDESLSKRAASYAKELCETKQFKHDPRLPSGEGENLFYSSGYSEADICIATFSWYDEVRQFNWNQLGTLYNFYPIGTHLGHFTQMVWKSTSKVGCAGAYRIEGSKYYSYIACRYRTAGNVMFQFPYNIGKTKSGLSALTYPDMCPMCSDAEPGFCKTVSSFDCSRSFFGVKDKCKKTCNAC